jgi:proteasome lid subunit RPN8/RPN11
LIELKLKIKRQDLESIEKHALKVFPLECCGLLIGKVCKEIFDVKEVVQAENVQRSAVSFEADAELVYQAIDAAEQKGLELIGIYHSHPNMGAYISARDAEVMKLWPNVAWLVLGTAGKKIAEKKAFVLKEGKVAELALAIS